jgi:hypothetical protein
MSEGLRTINPLSAQARIFHPDSSNRIPAIITNGSKGKGRYAREAGIPVLNMSDELRDATARAEDEFHMRVAEGIIAPAKLNGIPYPLVVAMEKLEGARRVLAADGNTESFFLHDGAYRLQIPAADVDVTIHKKKKKGDDERLIELLKIAAQTESTLSSLVGVARFDEKTQLMEGFTSEAILGQVRPFDIPTVINRLERDTTHAMGMPTNKTTRILVDRPPFIPVICTKYFEGPHKIERFESATLLRPETIMYPTPSNLPYQLAGIGFFL